MSRTVKCQLFIRPRRFGKSLLLSILCGFSHAEVAGMVQAVADACELDAHQTAEALTLMETYYDGYRFAREAETVIYNPTLTRINLTLRQRIARNRNIKCRESMKVS